jgi:hypothetical protein
MVTSSRWLSRGAQVALVLGAAACGGDSNDPSDVLITVSGSVTNLSGQQIPSTARVIVAWVVSATQSDYAYVYGEGTFHGSTFQVAFRQPPPAEALNAGQLGVGIVVLTTSTSLRDGVHLEDVALEPGELLGATGRHAVIYKATESVDQVDWEQAFPLGFNAGIGVDRENAFDAFAPTAPTSLELIVDDLDNIDFVNWT